MTEAEEAALVREIDANGGRWAALARRRVQHYGHRFEYSTRGVGGVDGAAGAGGGDCDADGDCGVGGAAASPAPEPLPPWLAALAARAAAAAAAAGAAGAADGAAPQITPAQQIDQITVNEYEAGVGLAPHVDTHSAFEGAILSLSLAGACVMEFRRGGGGGGGAAGGDRRALLLPRRSLLVMAGEARYAW